MTEKGTWVNFRFTRPFDAKPRRVRGVAFRAVIARSPPSARFHQRRARGSAFRLQ